MFTLSHHGGVDVNEVFVLHLLGRTLALPDVPCIVHHCYQLQLKFKTHGVQMAFRTATDAFSSSHVSLALSSSTAVSIAARHSSLSSCPQRASTTEVGSGSRLKACNVTVHLHVSCIALPLPSLHSSCSDQKVSKRHCSRGGSAGLCEDIGC